MGLMPNEFWSLTFFELAAISRGKVNQDKLLWNHTSTVMSLMANANRNPKKKPSPYKPSDFNPYTEEKEKTPQGPTKEQIEIISKWQTNKVSSA